MNKIRNTLCEFIDVVLYFLYLLLWSLLVNAKKKTLIRYHAVHYGSAKTSMHHCRRRQHIGLPAPWYNRHIYTLTISAMWSARQPIAVTCASSRVLLVLLRRFECLCTVQDRRVRTAEGWDRTAETETPLPCTRVVTCNAMQCNKTLLPPQGGCQLPVAEISGFGLWHCHGDGTFINWPQMEPKHAN